MVGIKWQGDYGEYEEHGADIHVFLSGIFEVIWGRVAWWDEG
jgi:hypothetical protein